MYSIIDLPASYQTRSRAPRPEWRPREVRYEWRVQYRRRGWGYLQARFYQSLPAARRMVTRLEGRPPAHLEPIVELYVQRRVVSEWEGVGDDLEDWTNAYDEARRRR
jgi:hypothetical protein